MKMKPVIIIPLMIIVGCNTNKSEINIRNSEIIDDRVNFSTKVVEEILDRHDVVQLGGNNVLHNHLSKVRKMIRKVEFHFQEHDQINFTEEYNFFNSTDKYDGSIFKKRHMYPNEALYIIDELLYEIRNSELGNDYFKYLTIDFDFKQEGDKLRFEYKPEQLLKSYFLGPKDSCTNDSFTKKHEKFYWQEPIDISSFQKGDTVTGGIAMKKMNHAEYIPFEYVKR